MIIHITSCKVQIPPISIPLFLVKLLHQLTKIFRHLYAKVTNSVVSSVEIPSDNPTFKENTSHINTSKLKPNSNDTLRLSKIGELKAKLDALKSLATHKISNLTNKSDSISLALSETSKTLEKRDVNNSKLL